MMDEMAGSESYRQAVGGSDELKQVMQSLGNHGQPLAVYKITLPDTLVTSSFGIDTSDWSDALKQNLRDRTASMIINQLNSSMGVAKLAAASRAHRTFFIGISFPGPFSLIVPSFRGIVKL